MEIPTLFRPVVTLLCGLLGLYIFKVITTYAKLRQFQGPSWTGISNLPHSIAMLGGNCHEWYARVNKKHGGCEAYPRHVVCLASVLRNWVPRLLQLTISVDSSQVRSPVSPLEF